MAREAIYSLGGVGNVIAWEKQWEFCHEALTAIERVLKQPEQEPKVNMCRVAQFKLDALQVEGFVVNGYAIERRNDSVVKRGFITDGGMVCWWFDRDHEPISPPKRQPLKQATIADAPNCLNTNDKAMWVIGWNECVEAHDIGDKT